MLELNLQEAIVLAREVESRQIHRTDAEEKKTKSENSSQENRRETQATIDDKTIEQVEQTHKRGTHEQSL